jgi:hypothetical protein
MPEAVLRESKSLTDLRGDAYEGIWRTTRPAIGRPGRFIHDYVLIRRARNGFLTLRTIVEDMCFEGWTFLTQTPLFSLTIQRVGGGSPVAGAVIMERWADLTGDPAADEAAHLELARGDPLAPEGSIPDYIRDHIFRDAGPSALAAGGMALLTMPFAQSMSRGPLLEGEREPGSPAPA